jgi:16S rRNA (cytosine967-C5)-methyltransferase
LDRRLQAHLHKTPPAAALNILRLGAAQILHLEVPAFAAVTTSVDLAERSAATRPYKNLVNAVLRRVSTEPETEPNFEENTPSWLFARWRSAYGVKGARDIAAAVVDEPATDLTVRSAALADAVAEAVGGVVLPGGSVRTARRGDVSHWPGYEEGSWWIQDAAAATPARLLRPGSGMRILDLCAAPGGKTLQLCAAGADVTALDRSGPRLERLRENLSRTSLTAELVQADAETWTAANAFDAVLLDAPCSASGTFRRHPDVLWAARPSDIGALAGVQRRLLSRAADHVRPGGVLVYCVCSLEPEEGEDQALVFLETRTDFAIEAVTPGEAGVPSQAITPHGGVRYTPGAAEPPGGTDGFFIVRMRKRL